MRRPYISLSVAQLEAVFAQSENDRAVLEDLLRELDPHRKTDRAKRLRQRVSERLAVLSGGSPGPRANSQSDLFTSRPLGTPATGDGASVPADLPTDSDSHNRTHRHSARSGVTDSGSATTSAGPTPPDDRRMPSHFTRIARPGVRGKPDAFQPLLDTSLLVNIPEGASRIQRFTTTLEALVNEMRRTGGGQRRYELENGKAVDLEGQQAVYAFRFAEDADIFEDAEVEIDIEGRRAKGQIVSISEGSLLVALDGDFGPLIARCTLVIDNTALLVALKERLEQASRGEIALDLGLADDVLDKDPKNRDAGSIAFVDGELNHSQHEALRLLLDRGIAFLWGPPGTGKTRTLSAFVEAAFDAGKRILVCSNTNKAVDQVLYELCQRLKPAHPAMEEGWVLRLGQIVHKELSAEFSAYVTADGILERRSRDIKRRQTELENEIARIDAQAAETNRRLGHFARLDQGNKELARLRKEIETLSTTGKAAVAARDAANTDTEKYQRELASVQKAGFLRRAFTRSEEQIRRDILRANQDAERQDKLALELRNTLRAARETRDKLAGEVEWLTTQLKSHDRKQLEAEQRALEDRRAPLLTELQEIARKLTDLAADIVRNARVIGTTVAKSYLRARQLGRFHVVIIDEASMVLLPALYFVAGLSTERVAISGDFRQLPPIVPSRQKAIHDQIGHDVFAAAGISEAPDPRRAMLDIQYRMNDEICGLISSQMYNGLLKTASNRLAPSSPPRPAIIAGPLTLVDTSRLWPFESRNLFGSRFNLLHALLVRNLVTHLRNEGFVDGPGAIGVCTPYAAQAKLLQRLVADHALGDSIDAGTVHRYQGDEKRMMILDIPEGIGGGRGIGLFIQGVPPEHIGARLLNVAVSRAQEYLVVFANLTYLDERLPSTAFLRHILYEMQERGRVVDGGDILALRPIERDLKGLLGVVELDLDAEKLGLFRAKSFGEACLTDISRAKKSVVIFSGFITLDRVAAYGDLFRAKVAEGVAIRCVTRPPRFNGSMAPEASKQALDALESNGAVVDCRREIHEKVVLIDNEIVWSGSLNVLSHTARTDEFMTRANSPLYAEQVAAFLSNRAGMSPAAAAATVAEAENPRCPHCGSRTYYSDGRYGPYYSCENEDVCGWRESARGQRRQPGHESSDLPKDGPPCPLCGSATRLRHGRFGAFYGCVRYPNCNGKANATARGAKPKLKRSRPLKG